MKGKSPDEDLNGSETDPEHVDPACVPGAPVTDHTPMADSGTDRWDRFFDTSHLAADLKGRAVRGGAATVVGRFGNFVVQTVSAVVLARLIAPDQFGLVAMITAITGFASLFGDFGLSIATIQRPTITHAQVSTLFWINTGIGLLITLAVISIAPLIAWFYGEAQLLALTLASAFTFAISGMSIQHKALLRRQMRFSAIAVAQVVTQALALVVGIIGALIGLRVWALVAMELAQVVFVALSMFLLCPWRPGLPRWDKSVGQMMALGAHFTGFDCINYFARNLDNILIGRFWGTEALGYYSKAYQLLMMPIRQLNAPLSSVVLPTLSRVQNEPERYSRYYCRTLNLIAFVSTPFIGISMVLCHELILLLLGPRWSQTAVLYKLLAISAWIQVFYNTIGWIYMSLGQGRRLAKWGLIGTALIALSFIAGLPWGPYGVALSYAISMVVLIGPMAIGYAIRESPIRWQQCVQAIWRPMLMSLVAYGIAESAYQYISPRTSFPMNAILVLLIWLLAIGVMLGFWTRLRCEAHDLLSLIKMVRA